MGQSLRCDFPKANIITAGGFVVSQRAESKERSGGQDGQKRAELKLNDLENCLHEQKDGLLITNGEGIGLWVNKAMEKVVGLAPDCFLHRPISQLFENGIFQYQAVTERARCEKNELTDVQVVNTGNTVLVTSVPIINQKEQIKYMITTVRNMAQLQRFSALRGGQFSEKADLDSVLRSLGMVYNSQAMQKVVEIARRVAVTDATVLITGETGVGKEIIAELIHKLSPRRNKPFLKINCAALPKELAESELFGYEPGAFTGARAGGKAGFFEAASGGTLLLDEVGELPLEMQAKLLRVLQDQEVLRLGGVRATPVNVRILAATNADLLALVNKKRFRPDLYYRLNVVSLEVPPLRLRPADVPLILGHYLRVYGQKYRISRKFHPETFKTLLAYSWPGNVRELANLVHRLVLVSSQEEITPDLLPEYIKAETAISDGGTNLLSTFSLSGIIDCIKYGSLREVLESIEKGVIEAALKSSHGIRDASRKLGIPHPTLIGKMKKYCLKGCSEEKDQFSTG